MRNTHSLVYAHVCIYEESGKKLNILYSHIYESGQKLHTVTILPLEERWWHIPDIPMSTVGNSNHSTSQILQFVAIFFSRNNATFIKTTTATYVIKRIQRVWCNSGQVRCSWLLSSEMWRSQRLGRFKDGLPCSHYSKYFWNAYPLRAELQDTGGYSMLVGTYVGLCFGTLPRSITRQRSL